MLLWWRRRVLPPSPNHIHIDIYVHIQFSKLANFKRVSAGTPRVASLDNRLIDVAVSYRDPQNKNNEMDFSTIHLLGQVVVSQNPFFLVDFSYRHL